VIFDVVILHVDVYACDEPLCKFLYGRVEWRGGFGISQQRQFEVRDVKKAPVMWCGAFFGGVEIFFNVSFPFSFQPDGTWGSKFESINRKFIKY
jgi:hypothetical protein